MHLAYNLTNDINISMALKYINYLLNILKEIKQTEQN